MTARLQAIADAVPCGTRVADIGTDHAKLPMWLARHKGCVCIAADKNSRPLYAAKSRIEAFGNTNGIDFRLGDGLSCINSDETDVIIIAGMGGDTICGILVPWARDKLCILQPNTHPERLRRYLIENGYNIDSENIVFERKRKYIYFICDGRAYETE